MSKKVHAFGDRWIGRFQMTACNGFTAAPKSDQWAVTTSENLDEVTCKACLKNLAKPKR